MSLNSTDMKTMEFPPEVNTEKKVDLNLHSIPINLDDLNSDVKVNFNDSIVFFPEPATLHGPFKIDPADPQDERVNENPPVEMHHKAPSLFNPLENIILEEEIWKEEETDVEDVKSKNYATEEIHLDPNPIEFKIVNMTKEAQNHNNKSTSRPAGEDISELHYKTVEMKPHHKPSSNPNHKPHDGL